MENYDNEYYNREDLKSLLFECIHELLELSVRHGFEGNLWHTYLTFLLASDENAYSTSCEIVGAVDGSINAVALHDFEVMKELFDYDFAAMEQTLEAGCFAILRDYRHTNGNSKVFNTRIRNRICDLSRALAETESAEAFQETMTQFYREFGVGKLGLHKAFRVVCSQHCAVKSRIVNRNEISPRPVSARAVFAPNNFTITNRPYHRVTHYPGSPPSFQSLPR